MNCQPPWVPSLAPSSVQASNLKSWVNVTDLVNVAGDSIATLTDRTANGNNFVQATGAAKPTYRTSIFGSGAKPAIEFATDDFMTCDGMASLFSGSDMPFSFYLLYKHTNTTGTQRFFSLGKASTATPFTYFQTNQASRTDDAALNATRSFAAVHLGPRIIVVSFTGTAITIRADGGSSSGALDVGTMTVDRLTLGCLRRNTNANFMNAYLAEFAMWNVALTTDEMQALENYGNQNWIA